MLDATAVATRRIFVFSNPGVSAISVRDSSDSIWQDDRTDGRERNMTTPAVKRGIYA
jgi:hypothetical protein